MYVREITSLVERVTAELHRFEETYNRIRDAMEPIEEIASGLCDKKERADAFSGKVKTLVHAGENALAEFLRVLGKHMDSMDMTRYMLRLAKKEFEVAL